jgi:phage/plasmid-associated DNA primase
MNFQNLLSLKISPSENLLDGITLHEPVDVNVLEKLINSTLLKDNFNNPFSSIYFTTEKQQLIKYKALIKDGKAVINYNRSKNSDGTHKNPYGRSNPDNALGLYSIRREIRHTLSKKRFTDIDIDNAHPQFLYQILKANENDIEISFKMLEDYVLNRQKYFDLIMNTYGCNRDTAKNLFLILLFGGGFKKWVEKNTTPDKKTNEINLDINKVKSKYVKDGIIQPRKEIIKFKEEFDMITTLIAYHNPDLCEKIKEIKKQQGKKEGTYNLYGSICSFFLQEVEIRVLEIMFNHCIENKYVKNDICVLCADGLMIETINFDVKILKEFNEVVKTQTGLDLKFSTKEMSQDYLKILDKNLCFDLYTPPFTTGLIADYFKVMYSNKFVNVDGLLYSFNGLVWKEEDKKHSNLHNFIDNVFYSHLCKYIYDFLAPINAEIAKVASKKSLLAIQKEKVKNMIKTDDDSGIEDNNQEFKNMTEGQIEIKIKELEAKIKEFEEEKKVFETFNSNLSMLRNIKYRKDYVSDIINKLQSNIKFDENPYLLSFNNKVYDLKTNDFIKQVDYDLYIKQTTGYDWVKNYQQQKIDKLDKLLDTIFPNKGTKEYYLSVLATGLYGEQIENLFVATGGGGNGKSLINSLMLKAVGNYGYKLPSSVLLSEIKEGGNPQVAGMHNKRFVLCQEPDKNRRINTSTLKEITGDKTLNTRLLHSNQCMIKLVLTLLMECNELPKLDEVNDAIQRRLRGVPFVSKFVSKEIYDELEDKTNVFEGDNYYKSDEFQEDYKQALIMILLKYWKIYVNNNMKLPTPPEECKKITNDYLATSDDIFGWFKNSYEKNNDINDKKEAINYVKVKELYQHFTGSTYFQNMTKKDKRELTEAKFRDNINKNMFLKQYYKDRNEYKINGNKITSPIIIFWKAKNDEDDNQEHDIFEEENNGLDD